MSVNFFVVAAFLQSIIFFQAVSASSKLIVYWGQDTDYYHHPSGTHESSLDVICKSNEIETIIIGYLNIFFDHRNSNNLPHLSLASHHCATNFGSPYPEVLHCPTIANHIKKCQANGIKVMLSMGGPAGAYGFTSKAKAIEFADIIWNMFLGGSSKFPRPFDDAILDGISLDIESGTTIGYAAFVKALRLYKISESNTEKKYYISVTSQCPYPDHFVGPSSDKLLDDKVVLAELDFISIQYFNNYCHYSPTNKKNFIDSWSSWVKLGEKSKLKVFVCLTAKKNVHGYVERSNLPKLLDIVKASPAFGGVAIWDCGSDQNNIIAAKTYSQHIYSLLNKDITSLVQFIMEYFFDFDN